MLRKENQRYRYLTLLAVVSLSACGGGGGGSSDANNTTYSVTTQASSGGTISPTEQTVVHGGSATFTLTPLTGHIITGASGCDGVLTGNSYTTGAVTASCRVSAIFAMGAYSISATGGSGGTITPSQQIAAHGEVLTFTLTPEAGNTIESVSGCAGSLTGNVYTTAVITSNCDISVQFTLSPTTTPPVLKFNEGYLDKSTLG